MVGTRPESGQRGWPFIGLWRYRSVVVYKCRRSCHDGHWNSNVFQTVAAFSTDNVGVNFVFCSNYRHVFLWQPVSISSLFYWPNVLGLLDGSQYWWRCKYSTGLRCRYAGRHRHVWNSASWRNSDLCWLFWRLCFATFFIMGSNVWCRLHCCVCSVRTLVSTFNTSDGSRSGQTQNNHYGLHDCCQRVSKKCFQTWCDAIFFRPIQSQRRSWSCVRYPRGTHCGWKTVWTWNRHPKRCRKRTQW